MPAIRCLFHVMLLASWPLPGQAALAASEPEWGQVPTQHFAPRDYAAHPQSFDVIQGKEGHIFVANGLGVLEFDGVRWHLHRTVRGTAAFSLGLDADGRVHVGAQGEIGYLGADALGELAFVSLTERIPEQHREFSTVWYVERTAHGVHFVSREAIFTLQGETVTVLKPQSSFARAFPVRGELLVQDSGIGLFRVAAGGLVRIDDLDALKTITLAGAIEMREGTLFCVREVGCQLHRDGELAPWPTPIDARIQAEQLYRAMRLSDGRILLATLANGAYLLDAQGGLVRHFSADLDLPTSTVYQAFEDRLGGLWLATDRGIVRLALDSPISTFERSRGLEGMVLAVHRHLGRLHVGTGSGLFALAYGRFLPVAGVGSITWAMLSVDDDMLVGGDDGVYRVHPGGVELVRGSLQRQVNALLHSRVDPERVFVGSVGGLSSLRRVDGRWTDEGPVAAVTEHARMLHELDDGRLWIATQHQSVLRLGFPAEWKGGSSAEPVVERFDESHGLPGTFNINIYPIGGELLFSAVNAGVFRFDEDAGTFEPDLRFARAIGVPQFTINPMSEDAEGRIWLDLGELKGVLEPQDDGGFRWHIAPLAPIAERSVYVIHAEEDGVVWMGGADGLIRFDGRGAQDHPRALQAAVRRVERPGGGLLLGGRAVERTPTLPWENNAVRLEFAAPAFDFMAANRYQTRLDGLERDWSPWSTETYRDYTNLREGSYTFRVRARDAYGTVSDEARFAFSVQPPPYRTWWAWLLYGLGLLALLWMVQRWRTHRLRAQTLALEEIVRERTASLAEKHRELEDAYRSMTSISVTDQLTGLKNRHFLSMHMESDAARSRRNYADLAEGRQQGPLHDADLVFFLIDLDHFKAVNDARGHTAGDRALVETGRILVGVFRETDVVVRWGGEEFLAVSRFVERDQAPLIAERICAAMAESHLELNGTDTVGMTCSVGFACYPFVPEQPEALAWMQVIDIADRCLYAAKRAGRNTWVGAYARPGFSQFEELLAADAEAGKILTLPGLEIVSPERG